MLSSLKLSALRGLAKTLFFSWLLTSTVSAVSGPEWQQGQDLVSGKNWQGAYDYGQNLAQQYPRDAYGQWLIYVAAGEFAKSDPAFWDISAKAAFKAAALEPARGHAHRAHAIWCLWNLKDYAQIAKQAARLSTAAISQIGEHNYILQINYIAAAQIYLGQLNGASGFLLKQMGGFLAHPAIGNVAEAVNLLFSGGAKNVPELEKWFQTLVKVSAVKETNGSFLSALGLIAMELGDALYRGKAYDKANYYFSSALDADRATLAARDGFVHDELRIRQIAAAYRKDNPRAQGRTIRTAIMLIVPETRLNLPENADAAKRFEAGDAGAATLPAGKKILSIAIPENQKSFQYFSDSILALTGGEVEWRLTTQPLGRAAITQTEFRTDARYKRWIAPAKPQFIEPALSPTVIKRILAADAVVLMWPGVAKHPEIFITNGGMTEHPFVAGDASSHRGLWITEGDKLMREGGSALFYHHEFFHMVEWGYYDRPFPKEDHQCQSRGTWPSDYSGTTEFDFYEQTYLKHVLPVDNLARMEWKSGNTWLYKKKIEKR